jgi:hypothetical protein
MRDSRSRLACSARSSAGQAVVTIEVLWGDEGTAEAQAVSRKDPRDLISGIHENIHAAIRWIHVAASAVRGVRRRANSKKDRCRCVD